eukprot:GHVT01006798.1.p1 GENE.GHVT01006798.1~~GHVT01006798.1.p1  ORF type:complete len:100 (+),score=9.14 GHVT01006798.1:197-496(+)
MAEGFPYDFQGSASRNKIGEQMGIEVANTSDETTKSIVHEYMKDKPVTESIDVNTHLMKHLPAVQMNLALMNSIAAEMVNRRRRVVKALVGYLYFYKRS